MLQLQLKGGWGMKYIGASDKPLTISNNSTHLLITMFEIGI